MIEPGAQPYASNEEYLEHVFARADGWLKAQTIRWRATLASTKPASHWGMVLVSDAEIQGYLEAPYAPQADLPRDLEARIRPFWSHCEALGREIEARVRATEPATDLRLERLVSAFDLDLLEREVVALCLLIEGDGRLRRLAGYLQDDATRRRPSVELLEQALAPLPGSGRLRARLAGGALARRELIVLEGEADPLGDRLVRLDDRIAAFLLGADTPDSRLEGVFATVPPGKPIHSRDVVERLDLERLGGDRSAPATVMLIGPYGSGRREAAQSLSDAAGRPLLLAQVGAALGRPEGWTKTVDLVFREATLTDSAIAWRGFEALLSRSEEAPLLETFLTAAEAHGGSVFLLTERAWEPIGHLGAKPFVRVDLPVPAYSERRRLWLEALSEVSELPAAADRERLADELANGFQLTGGQIADALASARGEALKRPDGGRLRAPDLFAGCRRQSGQLLTAFARRIEPRAGLSFDQLVLPSSNRGQLDDLRLRIRHRSKVTSDLGFERRLPLGKGLVALFSGTSGTGKTLAAELLAGEQGVDLYKVDLSAVVSKYVGETEKNLDRVFAEAECSNALLFFDEADALFGKRGEVKEASDRWANLEINFLLQRIEEYPGVVVLTTNLRQNIDEGFLRRIQIVVEFPFPDVGARLAIWRGMFPDGLDRPDEKLLLTLAERFRLPGGSIKNVVVDAAHRAVADNGNGRPKLTARHLGLALGREYQKLGKPVTRSEFGDAFYGIFESELA